MFNWIKSHFVQPQPEPVGPTQAEVDMSLMKETVDYVAGENDRLEQEVGGLVSAFGLLQAEYQRLTTLRNSLMVTLVAYAGYSMTIPNDFVDGIGASMDAEDLTVTYERNDEGLTLRVVTNAEAQEMADKKQAESATAESVEGGNGY